MAETGESIDEPKIDHAARKKNFYDTGDVIPLQVLLDKAPKEAFTKDYNIRT